MTEMVETKRPVISPWKVRVLGGLASLGSLAAVVSAEVDLNGTIEPILTDVTELIPSIIDLVVAIVPAIIVMAVVGFVVTFFDRILQMMKL